MQDSSIADALADLEVLRQRAPRLAHEPDRGVRHRLAPRGAQEGARSGPGTASRHGSVTAPSFAGPAGVFAHRAIRAPTYCVAHGRASRDRPGAGAAAEPAGVRAAVATMRAARLRPEVFCEEMPAPQRIAPFASALVGRRDRRRRGGRHRPDHPAARPGRQRRLGRHVPLRGLRPRRDRRRAGHRPDAGGGRLDLADRGARRPRRGVHRAVGHRHVRRAPRASAGWPTDGAAASSRSGPRGRRCRPTHRSGDLDVAPHVEAWGELLCTAVGLPPVPDGVAVIPSRRGQRGSGADLMPDADRDRAISTRRRPTRRRSRRPAARPARRAAAGHRDRRRRWPRRARRSPAGTGPVAIDAERASGYRYSTRAYLIQLRREGSGTCADRPDRASTTWRRSQEALGGHRVDPARRHPGPALPAPRSGCAPTALFDTELAGRLLGYPRVGLATLVETRARPADAQGALGGRLVDAAAARAVAGVRRPRRRGAGRAARRARRSELVEAGKDEWARQEFEHLLGFEPPPRVDAVAAYVRHAPGPRPPRPRRRPGAVGGPRPARRAPRRHPGPDHPRLRDRRRRPGDARPTATRCWRPRASTAAARSGTPPLGRRAPGGRARCDEAEPARPAPRAATARRSPRLGRARPGRRRAGSRLAREALRQAGRGARACRSRTCSPPTTCAGCCGRRRPPATRTRCAAAVGAALSELGARAWQVELAGPVVTGAILGADEPPAEADATPEPADDAASD